MLGSRNVNNTTRNVAKKCLETYLYCNLPANKSDYCGVSGIHNSKNIEKKNVYLAVQSQSILLRSSEKDAKKSFTDLKCYFQVLIEPC